MYVGVSSKQVHSFYSVVATAISAQKVCILGPVHQRCDNVVLAAPIVVSRRLSQLVSP